MNYRNIFIFLFLLASSSISAFEINTHQAITKCALSSECIGNTDFQGAENLNYFAFTMNLNNVDYTNEQFESYEIENSPAKYLQYAEVGKGLGEAGPDDDEGKQIGFKGGTSYLRRATTTDEKISNYIDYSRGSFISLIEAGSILEDAQYINADSLAFGGDGRFNNHFYSAQFRTPLGTPTIGKANRRLSTSTERFTLALENSLRKSDRASVADSVTGAYGQRTDAVSWALDDSVEFDGLFDIKNRINDYNLPKAFNYYRNSFEGTEKERKENQAKLFVSLGHVIHLLQDLHSPGHVRNGLHPGGDYLEIFARHSGGFFLRNGEFPNDNSPVIKAAIKNLEINDDVKHYSYQDFMDKEAIWVSENFFSQAHNVLRYILEDHSYSYIEADTTNPPDVDLSIDECNPILNTFNTIFDIPSRNPLLSESNTILSTKPFASTGFDSIITNEYLLIQLLLLKKEKTAYY